MTEGQSRLLTSKDQNGLTILHKVGMGCTSVGKKVILSVSRGPGIAVRCAFQTASLGSVQIFANPGFYQVPYQVP